MLTRREMPVLIVNAVYIPLFFFLALRNENYEFVMYVAVVVVVAGVVLWKQREIRFDLPILWGLTLWGFLHMAGGNLKVGGDVLYNCMVLPVIERAAEAGEGIVLLRYDQMVHTLGFGVATLVGYHLLEPHLVRPIRNRATIACLCVLIGTGFGALNEVIEFVAVVVAPETNVGGYYNTAMDLCFNMVGASLAAVYLGARLRSGGVGG